VTLRDPDATPERVWAALRDAGIDDEVRALPEGLDTRLAADGSGLSIGQLQRLSLARALMSPVDLVLLDEPTAALDPSTEKAVADAIGRLAAAGATVIVVAHRPALIEVAHQIVRIEQQPARVAVRMTDVPAEETPAAAVTIQRVGW
jgi:ABC-type multidrug transport system fused ATPase/permease subunit